MTTKSADQNETDKYVQNYDQRYIDQNTQMKIVATKGGLGEGNV